MVKIKKDYNLKIISVLVAVLFLLNSTVYAIDLSKNTHLRKHLDFESLISQQANSKYLSVMLSIILHKEIIDRLKEKDIDSLNLSTDDDFLALLSDKIDRDKLSAKLKENRIDLKFYNKELWICYIATDKKKIDYIKVRNNGEFGPPTEKEIQEFEKTMDLLAQAEIAKLGPILREPLYFSQKRTSVEFFGGAIAMEKREMFSLLLHPIVFIREEAWEWFSENGDTEDVGLLLQLLDRERDIDITIKAQRIIGELRLKGGQLASNEGLAIMTTVGKEGGYGHGWHPRVSGSIAKLIMAEYRDYIKDILGKGFSINAFVREIDGDSKGKWKDLSEVLSSQQLELMAGDEIEIKVEPVGDLPEDIVKFILDSIRMAFEDEDYALNTNWGIDNSYDGLVDRLKAFKSELAKSQTDQGLASNANLDTEIASLNELFSVYKPKKPFFKVWVVCRQNRERSPIIASIIRANIPKELHGYFEVESYGLSVRGDPYVDEVVSRDRQLRRHIPSEIPDDVSEADLILVMTEGQKKELQRKIGVGDKIRMVIEGEDLHIELSDPEEGSRYDRFRKMIRQRIDEILIPIVSECRKKAERDVLLASNQALLQQNEVGARLASNATLSFEDLENIIKEVVERNRMDLLLYLEKPHDIFYNPLSARTFDVHGPCGEATSDIQEIFPFLIKDNKEVEIKLYQAKDIFGGHSHAFIVISYKDKDYLVDTTFIQFFNPLKESIKGPPNKTAEELFYPWYILKKSERSHWIKLVHQLLKDGYIELTDEVADMYGNLLRGKLPLDKSFKNQDILGAATVEPYYSSERLSEFFGDLDNRASRTFTEREKVKINHYLTTALQVIALPAMPDEKEPSKALLPKGLASNINLRSESLGASQDRENRILTEIRSRQDLFKELKEISEVQALNYAFSTRVSDLILRLELLHAIEVLKGNLLYLSIGNDYFTSYFTRTFGINNKRGLGVTIEDIQQLEDKAIELGLPGDYKGRPRNIKIFGEIDNFDYRSYFPEILNEGGIDVLFIKGLTDWIERYKSFPGGESFDLSDELEEEKFYISLRNNIRTLVARINKDLLNEGGFIVIAHKDDLWLSDFIMEELGHSDLLAQPQYGKIREVLSEGVRDYDTYFVDTYLGVGPVPVRIFQKPKSPSKQKHLASNQGVDAEKVRGFISTSQENFFISAKEALKEQIAAKQEGLPEPSPEYIEQQFWEADSYLCYVSAHALANVLSKRFDLPIGGDSPDRIELILGSKGFENIGNRYKEHMWIALVIDGERRLLIDPSYGQYDESYRDKIVRGDYYEMLKMLDLYEYNQALLEDEGLLAEVAGLDLAELRKIVTLAERVRKSTEPYSLIIYFDFDRAQRIERKMIAELQRQDRLASNSDLDGTWLDRVDVRYDLEEKIQRFAEVFQPVLHEVLERGTEEIVVNGELAIEKVSMYPRACLLGCIIARYAMQRIYGDRITVKMVTVSHPQMERLKISSHAVMIILDNVTDKKYFLSFFEGIWDDTSPVVSYKEVSVLRGDSPVQLRPTREYIRWFKEQEFPPVFFEFEDYEDIFRRTDLTILNEDFGQGFDASFINRRVIEYSERSNVDIDGWIAWFGEKETSQIEILTTVNLNNLKNTPVLFLEDQVRANPEGFKKALKELDRTNIVVVIVDPNSRKDFTEKFCVDKGLIDLDFSIRTAEELGLYDFNLNKATSLISGIENLKCIPLTKELCRTYRELQRARDEV